MQRYIEALPEPEVLLAGPPFALDAQLARLPAGGPAPARCAVDLALHDRWAARREAPLYELLGLDPAGAPPSSVTISLSDDPDALREAARARPGASVLKLKLGTGSLQSDERVVRVVQQAITQQNTDLAVDANEAWTVEEAARLIPRLAEEGLHFIEEPIRERAPEAWRALRERLAETNDGGPLPPLIADESVQCAADITRLAPAADGVNVKLAKAGGLAGARRWIAVARALERGVLLGCMIASSLAVTAAAHLAPLADHADLDGALSLADDPFDGVTLADDGHLRLPQRPGLGVVRRHAAGNDAPRDTDF